METKISCDVARDLMPLVKDGIASSDSEKLLNEHLNGCKECRELMGNTDIPKAADSETMFLKLKKKIFTFSLFFMFLAMFLGLSLNLSEDMFYNSLIMPLVGALGFVVFKYKAFINIPFLLIILNFIMDVLRYVRGLQNETFIMVISSSLLWAVIYSLFACLGIIIAALFAYAFKKEEK